jgi:hypothetical protein
MPNRFAVLCGTFVALTFACSGNEDVHLRASAGGQTNAGGAAQQTGGLSVRYGRQLGGRRDFVNYRTRQRWHEYFPGWQCRDGGRRHGDRRHARYVGGRQRYDRDGDGRRARYVGWRQRYDRGGDGWHARYFGWRQCCGRWYARYLGWHQRCHGRRSHDGGRCDGRRYRWKQCFVRCDGRAVAG